MVTKIEKHQCDICKREYNHQEDALSCENYGYEQPLAKVGDMVGWYKKGIVGWDDGDTFFDDLKILKIERCNYNPHYLEYTLGWESDEGKWVEEIHAPVENNFDFKKYCTLKDW